MRTFVAHDAGSFYPTAAPLYTDVGSFNTVLPRARGLSMGSPVAPMLATSGEFKQQPILMNRQERS